MAKQRPRDPGTDHYPRLPLDRSEESIRSFLDNLYRPSHDHLRQLEAFATKEKVSSGLYEHVLHFIQRHRS